MGTEKYYQNVMSIDILSLRLFIQKLFFFCETVKITANVYFCEENYFIYSVLV